MKKLADLVSEIPEVETHFSEGFGIKTIHRNPRFNDWKAEVLLLLNRMPKDDYVESIITSLEGMNGHNDVAVFYDVAGKLKALSSNEVEESDFSIKKGKVVSTAFSNYTLVSQIGQGGNGIVWESVDEKNEKVAIKFLERNDVRKAKRFKNEAFFCMKNTHKNIVSVSDFGVIGKEYSFYVMPLYQTTLRQRISQGMDGATALSVFIGIIEGLKFAHDKKVIHRDIKPENILFLKDSDEPVIADFGIAHFSEDELATAIETKKSERMANFHYAAPEQRQRGAAVGPQADLYAAGLILNEMFTKEVPSALEYKTIGSVAPEYAYLDYIFEGLYIQDPEKRLYPETKLLTELEVRAANQARQKEKEKISKAVINAVTPEDYSVSVRKTSFSNNRLFFELDNDFPKDWPRYLSGGYFAVSCVIGYDTNRLLMIDSRNLVMSLYGGEDAQLIRQIAEHVKTWVKNIGAAHAQVMAKEAIAEQKRKEAERQEKLERLEREAEINSALADL